MKALCLYLACLLSLASGQDEDYKHVGCVRDSGDRLLKGYNQNSPNQNLKFCVEVCKDRYFSYAGVQYGDQCYCGNTRPSAEYIVSESECNMKCKGNATQMCGGDWRMNVFETGFIEQKPDYKHVGCVKDSGDRLFKGYNQNSPNQNHKFCVEVCKARYFSYAGVQFGDQCFCDNTLPSEGYFVHESECNMKCKGRESQMCGGNWRMNVLETGFTGEGPAYKHVGCVKDIGTRLMKGHRGEYPGILSRRQCVQECIDRGFPYAGVQYGLWCYCDFRQPPFEHFVRQEECNVKCQGNQLQMCGGDFRMDVLEIGKNQSTGREQQPDSQNSLPKACRLPDYPENMYELFKCSTSDASEPTPRPGDDVASGRLVMVSCPNLGQQTGQGFSICSDGVWKQQIPSCTKSCPPISSSNDSLECHLGESLVECGQPFSPGSTVTVGCLPVIDVRVNLDEKATMTCQQSGTWSGLLPACTALNDVSPI